MNTDVKTPNTSLVWIAYLAVFLGVCGHASSEFFVKLSGLQGAEISVWRFFIGGLALVLVALLNPSSRNLLAPLRQDFWPIMSLSIGGMALAQFMFHLALDYASIVQVATLVTTMPILVVFVARVVEGSDITVPKLVSGVGAFLGCVLLLTDGYLGQLDTDNATLLGIALSLGCSGLGALYIVLVRPYVARHGAIRMTTYTFAFGALILWCVVGIAWGSWVDPFTLMDRPAVNAGAILALGVWNTCIGFILWLWGLGNIPDAARGNYLFFLKPVIAALLAVFILDDEITWIQIAAIVSIVGFVAAEVFFDQLRALLR